MRYRWVVVWELALEDSGTMTGATLAKIDCKTEAEYVELEMEIAKEFGAS